MRDSGSIQTDITLQLIIAIYTITRWCRKMTCNDISFIVIDSGCV